MPVSIMLYGSIAGRTRPCTHMLVGSADLYFNWYEHVTSDNRILSSPSPGSNFFLLATH